MPWIDKVSGVVEAWYAGSSGDKALANVLTGDVNPTGKLAMTFPKSDADLPHPVIPALSAEDEGAGSGAVDDRAHVESKYAVHYDEGLKVGYKWYESEHKAPLFPFGFGLSYTTYAYSAIKVDNAQRTVSFTVKNTGRRAGTEIAEVYATLPEAASEPFKRLVGWQRVELAPGESKNVTVAVDPRVMSVFDEQSAAWSLLPGAYKIVAGPSSSETPLNATLQIP
jgi:beta-glucosidase